MVKSTYSNLMQSRFFNPAFNSAIFDGPVRIYFAQFHETQALKIYFSLQNKFAEQMARAKEISKVHGLNVLVMLYPSAESFSLSFEGETSAIAQDYLGEDTVIGLNGPMEDAMLESVLNTIVESMGAWNQNKSHWSAQEVPVEL